LGHRQQPDARVSGGDPCRSSDQGGVAGRSIAIALGLGHRFPDRACVVCGSIGLAGYGISLVAFVLALRHSFGQTGAYFSTHRSGCACRSAVARHARHRLLDRGGAMAFGVWLHVTSTRTATRTRR
jgi:hypothetical protein